MCKFIVEEKGEPHLFGGAIDQKASVLSLGCLMVPQKKHKIHLGNAAQQYWTQEP